MGGLVAESLFYVLPTAVKKGPNGLFANGTLNSLKNEGKFKLYIL
jgi:hypothetical protein